MTDGLNSAKGEARIVNEVIDPAGGLDKFRLVFFQMVHRLFSMFMEPARI